MTLQSTGEISLIDIATEYGDVTPHGLTEFYGKPDVPASGELSITTFYGKSDIPPPPVIRNAQLSGVAADGVFWSYGYYLNITILGVACQMGMLSFITAGKVDYCDGIVGLIFKEGSAMPPEGTTVDIELSNCFSLVTCTLLPAPGYPNNYAFKPVDPADVAINYSGSAKLTVYYPQ